MREINKMNPIYIAGIITHQSMTSLVEPKLTSSTSLF